MAVGQKKFKKWDSNEYRVPRKFFRVPQVGQPRLRRKGHPDWYCYSWTQAHTALQGIWQPETCRVQICCGQISDYKSPLVLQEPMLPISYCEFHSWSTGYCIPTGGFTSRVSSELYRDCLLLSVSGAISSSKNFKVQFSRHKKKKTIHLHYKDRPVNAVWNNICSLFPSYGKHIML